MSALLWSVAIVWVVALAFWPARVACGKGHSWLMFFVFSLLLFLPALITAYLARDRRSLAGSGQPQLPRQPPGADQDVR